MRKIDVFSIIADSTRNKIVRRLDETGKAAYSDLLDSAEHIRHLTSTGNFNYHLNFLQENNVIVKDGIVYRLTERGKEIAELLKGVDQMWNKLEPILRGEKMSLFSWAERFQQDTGTKMQKNSSKFYEIEMLSDEKKVIGIIAQENCRTEFFKGYKPLKIEDCKMCLKRSEKETEKCVELVVSHPDLKYYISPELIGAVYNFLSTHFGEARIFAVKERPYPFLFRALEIEKDYEGCAFLVAPCVF